MRRGLWIIAFAIGGSNAFACEANVPTWRFGTEVSVTMTAESGAPCQMSVDMNSASTLDKAGIPGKPLHGKLRSSGATSWTYTSASKYKGSDSFTVFFTGHNTNTGSNGTAKLNVNVTVN